MNVIIIAVVSVTSIGAICALILNVASKFLYVKIDDRITELTDIMPGANCGACGYPGCSGYAEALVSGAKPNLCTPGGVKVLENISAILGIETGSIEKKIAVVYCRGDNRKRQKKMEYMGGLKSCEAAKPLFGGEGACTFGCIGYGDCKEACPSNAICMEDGLAKIIPSLCTGCGLCVKACPNHLILIENAARAAFISCRNIEKGAVTRKKCTTGCIACNKCVRECPSTAIVVENNLARIDYEKCSDCGHCAEVCVTKCIFLNNRRA